jgi:hypothetical protein
MRPTAMAEVTAEVVGQAPRKKKKPPFGSVSRGGCRGAGRGHAEFPAADFGQ